MFDPDYKDAIQKFNDFRSLKGECELLALSSPYGSGKTYTFKQLLNAVDFPQITFGSVEGAKLCKFSVQKVQYWVNLTSRREY